MSGTCRWACTVRAGRSPSSGAPAVSRQRPSDGPHHRRLAPDKGVLGRSWLPQPLVGRPAPAGAHVATIVAQFTIYTTSQH
jgi:hypothetical protein